MIEKAVTYMSDDESAEVADPSDGPLDDPALTVSLSAFVCLGLPSFSPHVDADSRAQGIANQVLFERFAVVGSVRDVVTYTSGVGGRTTNTSATTLMVALLR